MAICYALCCLGFTAINDFTFKLFVNRSRNAPKRQSCGMFVTIVGIVEVIILTAFIHNTAEIRTSILWGALGGLLSVTSNILLIESMKFQSAGVSSTIFRLNMVLVVIGGFLLFSEPVTPTLIAGTLCATAAIIAFIPSRNNGSQVQTAQARLGFILALLACVLRAAMSLTFKAAFNNGADPDAISIMTGLAWVVGGPVFMLMREHAISMPTKHELKTGVVSGIFVTAIIFFMSRMNQCGDASVVNPIAQMGFIGTFMLSVICLGEKLTPQKTAAIILGTAAVICLTLG